jgi:stage III sporulation protein SpoIIIAA
MPNRRNIKRNPSGGWDVLREGDRRAAVREETEERALARAREVVRREGGGEVRLINDAGKIVRSSRVPANLQSSSPRRRAA